MKYSVLLIIAFKLIYITLEEALDIFDFLNLDSSKL